MQSRLPAILIVLLALGGIGMCAYHTLYLGDVEIFVSEESGEEESIIEEEL